MESWWRTPVVTDRNAFDRIPSQTESARFREPGVETVESLGLPRISGCSMPHWMRGKDGSLAVVKPCLVTDILDGDKFYIGASEAIASSLARRIGVLVPPVQIWQRAHGDRPEDYYTASLRIFADSRDKPPEPVLASHLTTLAKFGAFDTWINNPDRRLPNLIYGSACPNPAHETVAQAVIAGIDHGFVHDDPQRTSPMLRHTQEGVNIISPTLWQQVRVEVTTSPGVQSLIAAIQNTPDAVIKQTVTELPDPLFPHPAAAAKAQRVEALQYRRDNIQALTMTAAGLA